VLGGLRGPAQVRHSRHSTGWVSSGGCRYVGDVTRVAWLLVNQLPAYELDTDFQTPLRLRPDKHQRHHSADRTSDTIKAYLWPALVLQNAYVYKAVVVTGGT
jgi:hypothetical protein